MWPMILDYTEQECRMLLRKYELEAYSSVMTALRAQGDLNIEKKKILEELSSILSIPLERHRSEVRRVLNDEKLYTIAYNVSGPDIYFEWTIEGKRIIPLLPRVEPLTAFTSLADLCSDVETSKNASLPEPSLTRSLAKTLKRSRSEQKDPVHKKPRLQEKSKCSNIQTNFNGMDYIRNSFSHVPTSASESTTHNIQDKGHSYAKIILNKVTDFTPSDPQEGSFLKRAETISSETIVGANEMKQRNHTVLSTDVESDSNTQTTIAPQVLTAGINMPTITSETAPSISYPKVIYSSANRLITSQPNSTIKRVFSPNSKIMTPQSGSTNCIQKLEPVGLNNKIKSTTTSTTMAITLNKSKTMSPSGKPQPGQIILVPANSKSLSLASSLKLVTTIPTKTNDIAKFHSTVASPRQLIFQPSTSKDGLTHISKANYKIVVSPKSVSLPNKSNKINTEARTESRPIINQSQSAIEVIHIDDCNDSSKMPKPIS